MSKKDKLIERFKSKPKDFTFNELATLLDYFGYYLDDKGKTSGSKIKFRNISSYMEINMHKPHNRKVLLEYQIKEIIEVLKEEKLI